MLIVPIVVETTGDFITPIFTILISVIALIVSISLLHAQKLHNKKSVRPAGYIELNDSIDGLSIAIVNRGCGPMFIKSFIARNAGGLTENNIYYHLPELETISFSYHFYTKPIGCWLLPGEPLILFSLKGELDNNEFINYKSEARNILKELTIEMIFTDVYDIAYPVYRKTLEWFGRERKKSSIS